MDSCSAPKVLTTLSVFWTSGKRCIPDMRIKHFGSKAAEYNLRVEKGDDYVGSSVLHISG